MKIDTITLIISGALLAGALIVLFAGHLRRRHRLERQLIKDLLRSYFKGDVPTDQLGRRARETVGQHFTHSDEFYSLVVSAFQNAVDASVTRPMHAWYRKKVASERLQGLCRPGANAAYEEEICECPI